MAIDKGQLDVQTSPGCRQAAYGNMSHADNVPYTLEVYNCCVIVMHQRGGLWGVAYVQYVLYICVLEGVWAGMLLNNAVL